MGMGCVCFCFFFQAEDGIRDRLVTGVQTCALPIWQVQSAIRVAKESWGLLSSDCRANRPHLVLCPEANVPLQGRQGSRGCIPDAPGETGIPLEWKQRTPLCSRVAKIGRAHV